MNMCRQLPGERKTIVLQVRDLERVRFSKRYPQWPSENLLSRSDKSHYFSLVMTSSQPKPCICIHRTALEDGRKLSWLGRKQHGRILEVCDTQYPKNKASVFSTGQGANMSPGATVHLRVRLSCHDNRGLLASCEFVSTVAPA